MAVEVCDENYTLRWKNFHSNLQAGFQDLLDSTELIDVTFACEGHSVDAHKNILAACSPYFRSLFKTNPCNHPIIFMQNVRLTDLKAILQFIYRGETDISKQDLPSFLKTAQALQIKGLTENSKLPFDNETTTAVKQEFCSESELSKPCKNQRHSGSGSPEQSPSYEEENGEKLSEALTLVETHLTKVNGDSLPYHETLNNASTGLPSPQWNSAGPSSSEQNLPEKRKEERSEGFLCSICNKIYTSRYNLKAHERNIHGKNAHPATCSICQKIFKNEDALRTHNYYKHTGPDAISGQMHTCKVCNKTYKLRHDLVSHEKNAHGEFARPFKCDVCDKFCKNWHAFQTHKSRHHRQDVQK